jgi:tRNA modification GTPase
VFASDDTIVAVATPAGRGGIGVVRLSGPDAAKIARAVIQRTRPLANRVATFARLRSAGGSAAGDEVLVTWFASPKSYTGEDVVEISAHGSPIVLRGILQRALDAGARLAQPGEFTLRAFLHGKRDLVQSEAVADLIDAVTPLQARVAFDQLDGTLSARIAAIDAVLFELIARLEASLDFPEEGYHFIDAKDLPQQIARIADDIETLLRDAGRGRLIREGATVVIAGRTNVGKSTLFNALVGADRAIVTDVPGTTRDLISERIDIEGVAVTLVDTAGARLTADIVERAGVARGTDARKVADVIVVVLDGSQELDDDDRAILRETSSAARIIVVNKSDIAGAPAWELDVAVPAVRIAAKTGRGLDALRDRLGQALCGDEWPRDRVSVSNLRHVELLRSVRQSLEEARAGSEQGAASEEFVLVDLQAARARLDEIVGRRTGEDVLRHIFEHFCIGK